MGEIEAGYHHLEISLETAHEWFKELDTAGDGEIPIDDFVNRFLETTFDAANAAEPPLGKIAQRMRDRALAAAEAPAEAPAAEAAPLALEPPAVEPAVETANSPPAEEPVAAEVERAAEPPSTEEGLAEETPPGELVSKLAGGRAGKAAAGGPGRDGSRLEARLEERDLLTGSRGRSPARRSRSPAGRGGGRGAGRAAGRGGGRGGGRDGGRGDASAGKGAGRGSTPSQEGQRRRPGSREPKASKSPARGRSPVKVTPPTPPPPKALVEEDDDDFGTDL